MHFFLFLSEYFSLSAFHKVFDLQLTYMISKVNSFTKKMINVKISSHIRSFTTKRGLKELPNSCQVNCLKGLETTRVSYLTSTKHFIFRHHSHLSLFASASVIKINNIVIQKFRHISYLVLFFFA